MRGRSMFDFFSIWVALVLFFTPPVNADKIPDPPDASRILSLIGPDSMGSACPISPDTAFTAGHVSGSTNAFGVSGSNNYRAENGAGWSGFVEAAHTSAWEDAGALRPSDSPPFDPLELAYRKPEPGERVYWIGFDWRTRKRAFERRLFTGKVQRVIAGSIILDTPTTPGSSGSCLLDQSGKVVGVIVWTVGLDDQSEVAVAVGLFPPYLSKKAAQQ